VGVKAEALPPFDRKAALAPEYSAAMFSLPAPGVVPEPVRTSFGWHAIRVTEILPAEETPYEKAAPILRGELSVARQTAAIQELLKELSRAHPVQVMKDVDDKLTVVDGAEAILGR
jgi:parvulin-like peptidyl-prolyl isomerase